MGDGSIGWRGKWRRVVGREADVREWGMGVGSGSREMSRGCGRGEWERGVGEGSGRFERNQRMGV